MTSIRLLSAFCLLVCMGCSSGEHQLVPVSGKVTLNGEALGDASVAFQPRAQGDATIVGPTSIGRTNQEGEFTLRVNTDDRAGAVVGEHTVWISTSSGSNDADDATQPKERVPAKYHDGSLRYSVPPGGTNDALIEL